MKQNFIMNVNTMNINMEKSLPSLFETQPIKAEPITSIAHLFQLIDQNQKKIQLGDKHYELQLSEQESAYF